MVPVANEFVLKAILVSEQGVESLHGLLSHVVGVEVTGLAIFDKRIIILVLSKSEALDISAETEFFVKSFGKVVNKGVNAVVVLLEDLLGVEIRNTFTAHGASEHILMGIDKGIDTCLTELVDHFFDLIKVSIIVLAFDTLNAFPHDSKTDKVHSPLLQVGDILVIEGVLAIKFAG